MKIALIGYGKMGQMVEKMALQAGHSLLLRQSTSSWDREAIGACDILIEFTKPEAVLENVRRACEMKKNIVIGTTGWDADRDEVRRMVHDTGIGALFSPNFSLGIHLLTQILAQAAALIAPFEEYDLAGIELHHRQKKDGPSGTAKALSHVIEEGCPRKKDFSFASVRCGSIPGTHTVLFDSVYDSISITHEAKGREGFAKGAVMAAEWLLGRQGFYTFGDCVQDIFEKAKS